MAEAERARLSRSTKALWSCAAVVAALCLGACTGSAARPGASQAASESSATTSTTVPGTTSTATAAASGTAAAAPRVDKVLVFVVENHSTAQMSEQMPYAAGLGRRYAATSAYTAVAHPSLPNYLAMAGGSTYGVHDDAGPARHPLPGSSVFGLALAHDRTAGVFAEGMTSSCQQEPHGRYAVKHNPWAYFPQERAACRRFDQPIDALGAAVTGGTLPSVGMVVPDLCHDAHDCSLASADRWFEGWMQRLQAGPDWRSGRLLVVLTADEDDHRAGNRVLTVFANPRLDHLAVRTPLDHYALARLLAQAAGAPAPRRAANAASVADALGLHVG